MNTQELSIGQIKFKAFDLGGHEVARRVWKDYVVKVSMRAYEAPNSFGISGGSRTKQAGRPFRVNCVTSDCGVTTGTTSEETKRILLGRSRRRCAHLQTIRAD